MINLSFYFFYSQLFVFHNSASYDLFVLLKGAYSETLT